MSGGGYRAQARREAKALAAEWIDVWLCTDDGWREAYTEAEQVRVREELERIRDRFEQSGPSAFFRQREAARASEAPPI